MIESDTTRLIKAYGDYLGVKLRGRIDGITFDVLNIPDQGMVVVTRDNERKKAQQFKVSDFDNTEATANGIAAFWRLNRLKDKPKCELCEGSGRVADPQHGHAFDCSRCGGTGHVR